jgi:hypothetical protein
LSFPSRRGAARASVASRFVICWLSTSKCSGAIRGTIENSVQLTLKAPPERQILRHAGRHRLKVTAHRTEDSVNHRKPLVASQPLQGLQSLGGANLDLRGARILKLRGRSRPR